jgi:hypothetical protein
MIHSGPFLKPEGLKTLLSETALCAAQVAILFRRLIGAKTLSQLESGVSFAEAQSARFAKLRGQPIDEETLNELRTLLDEERLKVANEST